MQKAKRERQEQPELQSACSIGAVQRKLTLFEPSSISSVVERARGMKLAGVSTERDDAPPASASCRPPCK